jgi:hypothetical protein
VIQARHGSIIGACAVAGTVAVYDGVLFAQGRAPSDDFFTLYNFVMLVLFVTWLVADSAERRRYSPSFDYGWFIWMVMPVFGTYYLVSTRRWRGLLLCLGMLALFMLPSLAEVLVYLFLSWSLQ